MPIADVCAQIKLGLLVVNNYSPAIHRFWSRVEKDGPVHETLGQCWMWTGGRRRSYGMFRLEGKQKIGAHRFSYELHVGPVGKDLFVLHSCDNPLCVNPEHLFLGTQQDNQTDKFNKNRQAKGENNGRSILTEEQVLEIRSRFVPYGGHNSRRSLACEFGVSEQTVARILNCVRWKHV